DSMPQFYYFCGHEQFQPETLVEHAQQAEAAGFDGILISEHFHPWVDDASAAGFAWSTLGAIAQTTKTVQLMTGVTTPLWRFHPGVVAQAAATIDRLSGGRFKLGVGTGENINEGSLGYTFPKYKERAARMREALEIMRQLLDGEKLTYGGDYYQTKQAKLYSPPAERVSLWLAAGGPKSAKLASEYADGIVVSVKDPEVAKERVLIPAGRTGDSKTPGICATRWSVLAQDQDEAWQALQSWRGLRAPGRLEAYDPAVLRERADSLPREEVLGRYSVVSSADELVEVYRPLVTELDADIVTIQITSVNQEETIRLLGKEVLPKLRALG
ncbi:MAG: TIGR03557 family F420-dependent LLM class oxidoreductase, partial [Chloroflexota bacterium]